MSEFKNSFRCYKCKQDLPRESFHKGNGTTPRNQVAAYCIKCISAYGKIWAKANPEKLKASYEKNKAKPKNKLRTLLSANTSDRSQLDLAWAWDKLNKQQFKCEITGKEFTWGVKDPTTLSIDRIDPTRGYTKDNVRFVCWWVNAAMGTWGLDKIKELIKEWQIG